MALPGMARPMTVSPKCFRDHRNQMERSALFWPGGQRKSVGRRGSIMKAPSIRTVRCAIYTRVSTEYGLDQEFNSLDAQYDAASAYIKSQAHAGWTLIRSRYDDHNRSDAARSSQLSILYSRAPAGQLPSEIQSPGTEFLDAETGGQIAAEQIIRRLKSGRRERNFWMQRREAKNRPKRRLMTTPLCM